MLGCYLEVDEIFERQEDGVVPLDIALAQYSGCILGDVGVAGWGEGELFVGDVDGVGVHDGEGDVGQLDHNKFIISWHS